MANTLLLSLSALASLIPATLLSYRRSAGRPDGLFWAVLAVALAGPLVYGAVELAGRWNTGLSATLWLSVTASMALFLLISLITREAWRLAPLLLPYLLIFGVLATIWSGVPGQTALSGTLDTWLRIHIAVSVTTYGLCTLAAVAGAAVFLQEGALKRKRPTELTHKLPSIADATRLQVRLLAASEMVLALGIATGMSEQYLRDGSLLILDHKTLLAILAFLLIGLLLFLHNRHGLRGQRSARLILLAYLLLTLAYPGVKFVTDVLLG